MYQTVTRCFGYVIRQIVHGLAGTISSFSCLGFLSTQEAQYRVHSAIASCDSYASFVVSNLPRATMTRFSTIT